MTHEVQTGSTGPRIEYAEAYTTPMTLELAYDSRVLDGSFFFQFFPDDGKWPQGRTLKRDVTAMDLDDARRMARLDEVDELLAAQSAYSQPKDERAKARFATPDQRDYIWLREKGVCFYCPANVAPSFMHADHYNPFKTGGLTTTENLRCACQKCNYAKGEDEGADFERLMRHPKGLYFRNALFYKSKYGRQLSDQDIEEYTRIMYVAQG